MRQTRSDSKKVKRVVSRVKPKAKAKLAAAPARRRAVAKRPKASAAAPNAASVANDAAPVDDLDQRAPDEDLDQRPAGETAAKVSAKARSRAKKADEAPAEEAAEAELTEEQKAEAAEEAGAEPAEEEPAEEEPAEPPPPPRDFTYPCLVGRSAGRTIYMVSVPIAELPEFMPYVDADATPETRAQRRLDIKRAEALARYLDDNPIRDDDNPGYVLPALIMAVDGDLQFKKLDADGRLGHLTIFGADPRFSVDGQHRRKSTEIAMAHPTKRRKDSGISLGDEHVYILVLDGLDLDARKQIFADVQRSVPVSKSLAKLLDKRDPMAALANRTMVGVTVFSKHTEVEAGVPRGRSPNLVSLDMLEKANREILKLAGLSLSDGSRVIEWWNAVAEVVPSWSLVHAGTMAAPDARKEYIDANATGFFALAMVAGAILRDPDWRKYLPLLGKVNFSRGNTAWNRKAQEGSHMHTGRVWQTLTAIYIKRRLKLPLTIEEEAVKAKMAHATADE